MKRNRKREPLRVGTVAKTLLVCVCLAGVGLGYVWQKNQIDRLGDEIRRREATLAAIQKRNALLTAQLAHLKSPAILEARCQQYNLGLTAPHDSQIIRLTEPGPEWDAEPGKVAATSPPPPPASRARQKVLARR